MVGVILAAGNATRLNKEFNSNIIKPILQVGNKKLIEYSLDNLNDLAISKAIIIVSNRNKAIINQIGTTFKNVEIQYVIQPNPRGLINAIAKGAEHIDDDVILQLSDEIFINPRLKECIDFYQNTKSDLVVTYALENDTEKIKGNFSIETNDDKDLLGCVEKPQTVSNNLKGTGFCIFNKECVGILRDTYDESTNSPNNLCDYFNLLIESNKSCKAICIADEEINVNTPEDLEYAKARISSGE